MVTLVNGIFEGPFLLWLVEGVEIFIPHSEVPADKNVDRNIAVGSRVWSLIALAFWEFVDSSLLRFGVMEAVAERTVRIGVEMLEDQQLGIQWDWPVTKSGGIEVCSGLTYGQDRPFRIRWECQLDRFILDQSEAFGRRFRHFWGRLRFRLSRSCWSFAEFFHEFQAEHVAGF